MVTTLNALLSTLYLGLKFGDCVFSQRVSTPMFPNKDRSAISWDCLALRLVPEGQRSQTPSRRAKKFRWKFSSEFESAACHKMYRPSSWIGSMAMQADTALSLRWQGLRRGMTNTGTIPCIELIPRTCDAYVRCTVHKSSLLSGE